MPVKDALKMLRQYASVLTRQELLTFRGQILSGDVEGAFKGIQTILRRRSA